MYIKFILVIVMFATAITGCYKETGDHFDNNSFVLDKTRVLDVVKSYYVEYDSISGFRNFYSPDLYDTNAILKIYRSLGIKMNDNQKQIFSNWLNSLNMFDERERANLGFEGMPLEYSLIYYLESYNQLEIEIPEKTKKTIIKHFIDSQQSSSFFHKFDSSINDEIITKWGIKIFDLLNEEFPKKFNINKYLSTKNSKNISDLLNYMYYDLLIDGIIDRNSYSNYLKKDINIRNDKFPETLEAIYTKSIIKDSLNLKYGSSSEEADFVQHNFYDHYQKLLSFEKIDLQTFSKLLYIYRSNIDKDQRTKLSIHFNNLFGKGGWNTSNSKIDLNTTNLGLVTLYKSGVFQENNDVIDKKKISNYLTNTLNSLEKDSINQLTNLKSILNINQLIRGSNINIKVKTLVDKYIREKDSLNIIELITLAEIYINLNDHDSLKLLYDKNKKTIDQTLDEMENMKKKMNISQAYIYHLLLKIVGKSEPFFKTKDIFEYKIVNDKLILMEKDITLSEALYVLIQFQKVLKLEIESDEKQLLLKLIRKEITINNYDDFFLIAFYYMFENT